MSVMINIKTIDEYLAEQESGILDEGIIDFIKTIWYSLVDVVTGSQKVFMTKLAKTSNKNTKVKMINKRIEELASDYIDGILEKGKDIDASNMVDIEKNLIQLFKLYHSMTNKVHVRDIHRQTGLFDRVFLWPDLIPQGVTKADIEHMYTEKINSIRTRAERKIKKAEEELAHYMRVLG